MKTVEMHRQRKTRGFRPMADDSADKDVRTPYMIVKYTEQA